MAQDAPLFPGLSPVSGKSVQVAFDGGRLTSDAGVLVLAEIERRLGIAERLARCLADPRDPERVRHGLAEMIRFRALLIAAGYPDGNDCDALRADPAFKLAVGHLPESGADLGSQPTTSRLENLPSATALKRMMAAMLDLFRDSFGQVPRRIVLDIDATEDRVPVGFADLTPWDRAGSPMAGSSSRRSMRTTTAAASCRSIFARRSAASRWPSSCGRGQAENFIKAHKLHLASDRTSCSRATANQFRLLIHTAADRLLHTLRGLAPKSSFWRNAQFDTIRLALIKVAGRVTELVTRIKLALPSSYPCRESPALLAARAIKLPP